MPVGDARPRETLAAAVNPCTREGCGNRVRAHGLCSKHYRSPRIAPRIHGTNSCYGSGCREPECRKAHTEASAQFRRAKAYGIWQPSAVDITGTRRRVEALATLGWSMRHLSSRLGWHPDRLSVMFTNQTSVSRANAQRIAALFDELCMSFPPERNKGERVSASRARALARRRGYAPPLAWDDIDDPDEQPQTGATTGPRMLAPCGTLAAARRHYRRGERLDYACAEADRVGQANRKAKRRTA